MGIGADDTSPEAAVTLRGMGATVRRTAGRIEDQRRARRRPAEVAEQPRSGRRGRRYVSVGAKFLVAQAVALCWLGASVWLSLPWLHEFGSAIGLLPAVLVISLVAYLPGWLVAFLAVSLLLDRQPPIRVPYPKVPVTVLIAARNEAERI
jgi:hypothetical protein